MKAGFLNECELGWFWLELQECGETGQEDRSMQKSFKGR